MKTWHFSNLVSVCILVILSALLSACGEIAITGQPVVYSETPASSGAQAPLATNSSAGSETVETINTGADGCVSPLVMLQTGRGSDCSGGNVHAWPVGLESNDCHGWSAQDNSGRLHENSANNITCNPDGTFSFTQFAGTLTCSVDRDGVTKTYALNSCEQDIPPSLYTKAINLTCCMNPGSPECQLGVPYVSAGASSSTIYLNGKVCSEE